MASDPHDRWFFLLALAPLPLACTEDPPDPVAEGSTGTTGGTVPTTMTTGEPEGSTTAIATTAIATTDLDGTSSTGDSTASDGSSGLGSSSSDDATTTMSIDPSTGEGSSSTGEQGLCELWGETLSMCYGYNAAYFTSYCYDYVLNEIHPLCIWEASARFQCEAAGCFANCDAEYDALYQCHQLAQAADLGCDMIPIVPGAGTIAPQCVGLVDQIELCTANGSYIPGWSYLVQYSPVYAEDYCEFGGYFTFIYPPPAAGDACGGAYEELLTCLSALSCGELELAVIGAGACAAQIDAVTCRCELGA